MSSSSDEAAYASYVARYKQRSCPSVTTTNLAQPQVPNVDKTLHCCVQRIWIQLSAMHITATKQD